ncbi:MAG TPA: hypothetical protein VFX50_17140, partial [Gemmatimonadales bacterium]|nr:hypothetical protein [Gemmatimonadales bacterium]
MEPVPPSFLRMTERTALLYGALFLAASLAFTAWRIRVARTIAEEWLARHRYRVRSLRHPWFALPRFAPRLFRNEQKAFQFRAEVDDLR